MMRILALVKTMKINDPDGYSYYSPFRSEIDWILNSISESEGYNVWVYDISEQVLFPLNSKRYFKVFKTKWIHKILRNPISFFLLYFSLRGKFDVSHIFYLRMEFQVLSPLLFRFSQRTFISIYGTDYYDYRLPVLFNHCLNRCTKFTTNYEGLNNRLLGTYGLHLAKKNQVIPFPIMFFEALKQYSPTKEMAKYSLGIHPSKTVVVIGTRAGYEEQYDQILKELEKIKSDVFQYIFTITYGDSQKNIDALEKKIFLKLGNDVMIFKNFLPIESIIDIRFACDIFVNLRSHDQFAGSMIESFYSECNIITGMWLEYHSLQKEGFFYTTIDSIPELSLHLMSISDNHIGDEVITFKLKRNRELIFEKYQNETTRQKWITLYKN